MSGSTRPTSPSRHRRPEKADLPAFLPDGRRSIVCRQDTISGQFKFILGLRFEVARVVTLVQLLGGIAEGPVDHAATLHRRTLRDRVRPAADVGIVLDRKKLCRAVER